MCTSFLSTYTFCWNGSLKFFFRFKKWTFSPYYWHLRTLYVFRIQISYYIYHLQVFSSRLTFHDLNSLLKITSFNLWWNPVNFFFLMYMFLVLLNTQDNKDILLFFFSRNVRVFGLVFTSRIIFYLIFVYGVRCDSKSIFWICLCNCLITILKNQLKTVFEHHLHKRLFSPQI